MAALCLAAAVPAAAQSRPTAQGVSALADSLVRVTDAGSLRALETQLIEYARVHRDDVDAHLRLGFIALRLADLAGPDPHLEDAAGEFEWATQLEPQNVLGWYGLGRAELSLVPTYYNARQAMQEMLGLGALDRARDAFRRALTVDPAFGPAAVGLGQVALARRLDPSGEGALTALRALPPAALDGEVLLVRGRVERRFGSLDSAAADFARAGTHRGLRGVALLERARALLAAGDTAQGAADYYSGARFDDTLAVAGYREDLAFVADSGILLAFDARRGAARSEWLAGYWGERSARALRPPHARLTEHYQRLHVAEREFQMPPFRRRYGFGEYFRPEDYRFDDRGVVYVRHGEPTERSRSARCASEVWMYLDAEPAFTAVFLAEAGGMDDYRLWPSVLDLGVCAREEFVGERGAIAALIQRSGNMPGWRRNEMWVQGKEDIVTATTTESHRRRFIYALPLSGTAAATAVPGRGGVLHVATAITTQALREAGYGPESDLRLRVSVLGADGTVVAFHDDRVRAELEGTIATFYREVRLPTGGVQWRVGMALDDSLGAELPLGQTIVPDAAGGNLTLSDLVLGWARTGVSWEAAPGDTAWMNPLAELPEGEILDVYYEAYGLLAGERYSGEFVVWALDDRDPLAAPPPGESAALRVRFSEAATGPVTRLARTVDVSSLRPGRYGVAVVAQDEIDRPAIRVSEIRITRR